MRFGPPNNLPVVDPGLPLKSKLWSKSRFTGNKLIFILGIPILSLLFFDCEPPFVSIFIIDWDGKKVPSHIITHDNGSYSLDKFYTSDSLNHRMMLAAEIEIYARDMSHVMVDNASLTKDSLCFHAGEIRGAIALDSLRELIIYDHSHANRMLMRAAIGGGILGGLASLAYVPPNPPNESPISNVFILTGAGAVVGLAIGDVGGQREIVIIGRMDEKLY